MAAEDERIALMSADVAETCRRRVATRTQAEHNEREEAPPEEEVPTVQELAGSLQEMVKAAAAPAGDTSESSSDAADETWFRAATVLFRSRLVSCRRPAR